MSSAGDQLDALLLSLPQKVLQVIQRSGHLGEEAEVTLEVNPTALETHALEGFRAAGVNRVSIGVQVCIYLVVILQLHLCGPVSISVLVQFSLKLCMVVNNTTSSLNLFQPSVFHCGKLYFFVSQAYSFSQFFSVFLCVTGVSYFS